MKLGTWLLAMMQPMLAKILTVLGFSVVSIVGVEASVAAIQQRVVDGVNGLGGDVLQVFLYAGGGRALGIILGAIAFRILLWQIQASTKIVGATPQ